MKRPTAESGLDILAVGDVFLDRPDPRNAFTHVRDIFDRSSIVFGNCEGVYAQDWERSPSAGVPLVASPEMVSSLHDAGFTVMSLANNHIGDAGLRGMLGTREVLTKHGISTVGIGANQSEAREPAILETAAGKVAILAYSSVFPHGYEARPGGPGLVPLRAHTAYLPWEENEWNPGLLPRVVTMPHPQDFDSLRQDIAAAKQRADLVLISIHWGDFTRPYVLTDHERRTARFAIDAGADAIFGHHHHLLRGIEFYRGKPILYGLGHFVFDLPNFEERLQMAGYLRAADPATADALARRFGDFSIARRDGYPLLPFHPDGRLTVIAVLRVSPSLDIAVSAIPCILPPDNCPVPVDMDSVEGKRVADYLRIACEIERLGTSIGPGDFYYGYPTVRVTPKHNNT